MFGLVPKNGAPFLGAPFLGTRPNISESHSEISTRVPLCIRGGRRAYDAGADACGNAAVVLLQFRCGCTLISGQPHGPGWAEADLPASQDRLHRDRLDRGALAYDAGVGILRLCVRVRRSLDVAGLARTARGRTRFAEFLVGVVAYAFRPNVIAPGVAPVAHVDAA